MRVKHEVEDIRRLDVSMNDIFGMSPVQSVRNFNEATVAFLSPTVVPGCDVSGWTLPAAPQR